MLIDIIFAWFGLAEAAMRKGNLRGIASYFVWWSMLYTYWPFFLFPAVDDHDELVEELVSLWQGRLWCDP